jgi:hypothetical protein
MSYLLSFLPSVLTLLKQRSFNGLYRLNLINTLRTIYAVNIILALLMVCGATFKNEKLLFKNAKWEQMLSPFYFYMTECLLVGIVSFVVMVNSFIQLCCHGANGTSNSRMWNRFELKNAQESNNTILTNPSALVRVSLWCLYITICGLLSLFLLLKNSGRLSDTEVSILYNKGELVILYFGGLILLTLLFYRSLR